MARLEGVLRTLNPDARIHRASRGVVRPGDIMGTGLYDEVKASEMAGWKKELNGDHVPETEEYGISSFVFHARRPFHPGRLRKAIDNGLMDPVIRSKGYAWLATRPQFCTLWKLGGQAPHARWRGLLVRLAAQRPLARRPGLLRVDRVAVRTTSLAATAARRSCSSA